MSDDTKRGIGHYFATVLNLRPEEGRRVAIILGASFFLGSSLVFFYTASNAIFLTTFDISALPYIYIANAVLAVLFGILYSTVEKRTSFNQLLTIINIIMTLVTLLLWGALDWGNGSVIIFLSMTWFRLLYIYTRLGLLEVAALSFDVRQAKRIFTLVALGLMIAFILGGLLTPAITNFVDTNDLILISALSLIAYTVILSRTLSELTGDNSQKKTEEQSEEPPLPLTELLRDKFVLAILGIKTMATLVGFVTEYAFFQQAATHYVSEEELASFLGIFMGITMMAMIIIAAIFAGRYISRYGIRITLATTPFLILFTALLSGIYGTFLGQNTIFFFLIASVMAVNQITEKSFFAPAVAILYQPLPPLKRRSIIVVSEGWFSSVALLLSGFLLLLFGLLSNADIMLFVYLLVGMGGVFLWISLYLYKLYRGQLKQVIEARFTRGIPFDSRIDFNFLTRELHQRNPGSSSGIFTLASPDEAINNDTQFLPDLLTHQMPQVQMEALRQIEKSTYFPASKIVKQMANSQTLPISIRGQAFITLSALGIHTIPRFEDVDADIQPYILIGSLRYGNGSRQQQETIQYIARLSEGKKSERLEAIRIMEESATRIPQFSDLLVKLIGDKDEEVQQAALQAAGGQLNPDLVDELITMLPTRQQRLPAVKALSQGSDQVAETLITNFETFSETSQQDIFHILGQIRTQKALKFLVSTMFAPQHDLNQAILTALRDAEYQHKQEKDVFAWIEETVESAQLIQSYLEMTLPDLLHNALEFELLNLKSQIFLLLGLIYDVETIKDIERFLIKKTPDATANALEMLEIIIPYKLRTIIFPVLEDEAPKNTHLETEEIYRSILNSPQIFNEWTQHCVHYATQHEEYSMLDLIEKVAILRSVPIFAHTPDQVLAEIAEYLVEGSAEAGTNIITKGEIGNRMYVIITGEVRIMEGDFDKTLGYRKAGDIVGEMALLDPAPRSATVTAFTDVRYFSLSKDVLYDLMAHRPEIIQSILRVLVQRLRTASNVI